MPHLSISSSERSRSTLHPGVIILGAIVGFLVIDHFAFDKLMPWQRLSRVVSRKHIVSHGIVDDERSLIETVAGDSIAIGASRIMFALNAAAIAQLRDNGYPFSVLAHPGLTPYTMRALAADIVSAKPSLVVFGLSELDTHSGLRLQPSTAGKPRHAFFDLLFNSSPGFIVEHRTKFLRLALAATLNSYRLRILIDYILPKPLTSFHRGKRFPLPYSQRLMASQKESIHGSIWEIQWTSLMETVEELEERFPGRLPIRQRPYFKLVRTLSRGEHVKLAKALIRNTIEHLHNAGVPIAIIELPIYPIGRKLYDPELRTEFLHFALELVDSFGVRFVPLEAQAEFNDGDFTDMTHVNPKGAKKIVTTVLQVAQEMLPPGSG